MAKSQPLKGIELIDCARANAKHGLEETAKLAGYGEDVGDFKQELQQACHDIGVEIKELSELIPPEQVMGYKAQRGIEVAPDSISDL